MTPLVRTATAIALDAWMDILLACWGLRQHAPARNPHWRVRR
jgi:hypothetical protein